MELGPHATFIVTSYALAALIVVGLIVWVLFDHRAQRRLLAELEQRGVTRGPTRTAVRRKEPA